MKRRFAALMMVMVLFLSGCNVEEDINVGLLPGELTGETSEPTEIIVPYGAATVSTFGIAYAKNYSLNPFSLHSLGLSPQ